MDKEKYLAEHSGQRRKCEVWTRVMGYHRPISQWNDGKHDEAGRNGSISKNQKSEKDQTTIKPLDRQAVFSCLS